MGTAFVASIAVTCLWVFAHLFRMQCNPVSHRLASMIRMFLLSLPFLMTAVFLMENQPVLADALNGLESPILAYCYALILHILLFFLFVEIFYHVERSVTLRLLLEIHEAHQKPTVAALMHDYSVDDMIVRRLQDMAAAGWARQSDGKWKLSPKGNKLAALMRLSCWLFQSKPQNERL